MSECNGICIMGWEVLEGYGGGGAAYPHPDCEKHGRFPREWCEACAGERGIDEEFDEQIGFEEQAREVRVTRLSCGHEIVRPRR